MVIKVQFYNIDFKDTIIRPTGSHLNGHKSTIL